MNEDELRSLIRKSIARQLSEAPQVHPAPFVASVSFLGHPSQYRYTLPESDGPCLIEPAVACNHCGYCQSHGH